MDLTLIFHRNARNMRALGGLTILMIAASARRRCLAGFSAIWANPLVR
jgi:hypothetical protein